MNRFIELDRFYFLVSNQKFNKTTTYLELETNWLDNLLSVINFGFNSYSSQ